ncbi:MAG: hypothetical protein AB1453_12830 [Chloroflexota bacterium]|jgi:hypothetical protein
MDKLSRLLDYLSAFLAARKGLLPIIGLILIITNLLLQFLTTGWLAESNLLLHLGIVLAILGFMLAWAL